MHALLFQSPFTALPYPHTTAVVSAKVRPLHHPACSGSYRTARNTDEDEGEKDGRGIRGTDVLRALQRAAARKKKAKQQQKRRELSPAESRADDKVDGLREVREVQVKSEWSSKLDELERRLRELDDGI